MLLNKEDRAFSQLHLKLENVVELDRNIQTRVGQFVGVV